MLSESRGRLIGIAIASIFSVFVVYGYLLRQLPVVKAPLPVQLQERMIDTQGKRIVKSLEDGAPLWELCAVIDDEREVDKFTMTWYDSAFDWQRQGTAVYDRGIGTLVEYLNDGDGKRAVIYSGVTDHNLHLLNQNAGRGADHGLTFEGLSKYGCTREVREDQAVGTTIPPQLRLKPSPPAWPFQ